jgi:RNA polymerase-binding transcription factor DksA
MSDLAQIKANLEERLRKLTERAVEIDDDLRQPGDDDWSEQAIESADDETLEGLANATMDEIRQIQAALTQIKAGKYGICVGCGGAIARKRLAALPSSTRCVKCA